MIEITDLLKEVLNVAPLEPQPAVPLLTRCRTTRRAQQFVSRKAPSDSPFVAFVSSRSPVSVAYNCCHTPIDDSSRRIVTNCLWQSATYSLNHEQSHLSA